MKKDFLLTFATEFFVLASGLLVFKLVAQVLGKDDFLEYSLIRRTVSLIQPALLLGLGVGIPRYMSFSREPLNPGTADPFFTAGLCVLLPASLAFGILLLVLKRTFAFLFFGSSAYAPFIPPIGLMLLGLVLHAAVYSYFRGRLRMGPANLIQLINLALAPPAVLFFAKRLLSLLIWLGIVWTAVSFIFLAGILIRIRPVFRGLFRPMKTLLIYGLQRVPGDFGLAALLALPATFTAHLSGVSRAGAVAFGISVLNMAGTAFAPIGLILLPKASRMIAAENLGNLRRDVRRILAATIVLTAAGVLVFELFAGTIIGLYLGRGYADMVFVSRIIVLGSLAYTIYVSLRSIIDAYHVKAVNTLNIFIALILYGLWSAIVIVLGGNSLLIVIGFVLALFALGLLTLRETSRILAPE